MHTIGYLQPVPCVLHILHSHTQPTAHSNEIHRSLLALHKSTISKCNTKHLGAKWKWILIQAAIMPKVSSFSGQRQFTAFKKLKPCQVLFTVVLFPPCGQKSSTHSAFIFQSRVANTTSINKGGCHRPDRMVREFVNSRKAGHTGQCHNDDNADSTRFLRFQPRGLTSTLCQREGRAPPTIHHVIT